MMSQIGFAPARSIKGLRLIVTAVMAVGVFAVGLLSVPEIASADTNCSNVTVNVVCMGDVNPNNIATVTIGDVGSGNDLSALTNNLNDAMVAVANIQDVNILSVDLNTLVQTAVNTFVTTTTNVTTKTCTVAVAPPVTPTGSNTITITCS